MKKIFAILLLVCLFVSLVGCTIVLPERPTAAPVSNVPDDAPSEPVTDGSSSGGKTKPKDDDPKQADEPVTNSLESYGAEGVDWNDGDLFAIGFVGYMEGIGGISENPLLMVYDDLYSFYEYQDYVAYIGDEIFFIFPRYADATVTIEQRTHDDKVKIVDTLYEGGNLPVMFGCNESDLYPNTVVTVTGNGKSVSFSPALSLMDGSINMPKSGGRDISVPRYGTDDNFLARNTYARDALIDGEMSVTYNLEFNDDGTMAYYYGWSYGEVAERLDGVYYYVGKEAATERHPAGTVIMLMHQTYVYGDEGDWEDGDSDYVFFAAYDVARGADGTVIFDHSHGELFYYEDVPGTTYTFEQRFG